MRMSLITTHHEHSHSLFARLSPLTVAILAAAPLAVMAATPENLVVADGTSSVYTENLTYYTENVGLGNSVYSGIRINGSGKLTVESENAFFTVHNMPDEEGKGDYTAFGMKVDANKGAQANFTGTNVTINARSAYGAQGIVFTNTGDLPATLNFNNSGTLNITAVVEGDGIARSNAIGILGNWQTLNFGSELDAVNVSVYGSGVFNGNALNSNGTSGLYFAGDTVTIDAKQLNVTVITGQDYTARLETAPGVYETVDVAFDEEAAKKLGASYAVTYGLNNKGNTTIGADTTTTITVHDGFWNAVGISNDPMYVDMDRDGNYSNYNLSDLEILGNVAVEAVGSSLGADSDSTLTGGNSALSTERLTATYGLYAGVTAIDGVEGYDEQLSKVVLGSDGKIVDVYAANFTEGAEGDVYGLYGSKADITLNGASSSVTVESSTTGNAYGAAVENATKLAFNTTSNVISVKGASAVGVSAKQSDSVVSFLSDSTAITAEGEDSVGLSVTEGAEAVFTGAAQVTAEQAVNVDATSKMTISGENAQVVANGLVVNAGTTAITDGSLTMTTDGSTLNTVEGENATVAVGAGNYAIATYSGTGNTILANDLLNLESVAVENVSSDTTVAANRASNNQYENVEATARALQEKVMLGTGEESSATRYEIETGSINDGLVLTKNEDGTWSSYRQENASMAVYSDVVALSALQWRDQLNDLNKRMGDLRDNPGALGAWVRLYGSEQELGSITGKSASVQVGADYQIGDWKVGGAFSYTDGSSDYDLGNADNELYTFAVYGTWLADNGMFVDLIGKYGRLSNDFQVDQMKGSFDNNAYSLSAEFGWRFEPCAFGFIEPQVELTYARIDGDTFTSSNQVRIAQDDFDSLIGRAGVRVGAKFPENRGNIYLRISGAYDFQGESEAEARLLTGASHRKLEDDLGGAWLETAVGANFRLTDASNVYVDLERTNGGEVVENWRWNVGFRTEF